LHCRSSQKRERVSGAIGELFDVELVSEEARVVGVRFWTGRKRPDACHTHDQVSAYPPTSPPFKKLGY